MSTEPFNEPAVTGGSIKPRVGGVPGGAAPLGCMQRSGTLGVMKQNLLSP